MQKEINQLSGVVIQAELQNAILTLLESRKFNTRPTLFAKLSEIGFGQDAPGVPQRGLVPALQNLMESGEIVEFDGTLHLRHLGTQRRTTVTLLREAVKRAARG